MKLNLSRNRLFVIIILWTAFVGALYFLFSREEKNDINSFLFNEYKNKQKLIRDEIDILNSNIDIIEELLIDCDIKKFIFFANKNPQKYRKKLLKSLQREYKILGLKNMHLHIYLKNGNVLLRFKEPNKYNNNEVVFRESLRLALHTKKIFRGFEVGRYDFAYRNLYPIFFDEKFCGIVEISYDIAPVLKEIFVNGDTAVILTKKYISNSCISLRKKLNPCMCSDKYFLYNKNPKKTKDCEMSVDFGKKIILTKNKLIFAFPIISHKQIIGYILNERKISNISEIRSILSNHKKTYMLLFVLYFVGIVSVFVFVFGTKFKNLAFTDELTRALNRHGCINHLKPIKRYALAMIDIDFFKKINDTYGHDAGDYVLKELSSIIRQNIRERDLFCRWGGEEFVLILPYTSAENGVKVLEKLRKKIENYDFNGIKVTISVGINEFDGDFESTLKKADEKLYLAKSSGRNKVEF